MWVAPRNVVRIVGVSLALWAQGSFAVDIAAPQVASFQGQNLNAFVDLQQLQGPQAALQVQVGNAADYASMRVPRYAVVDQVRLAIVDAPLGGARLDIRTSRPIVEPRLQLVVRFVDAGEVQLRQLSLAIPAPLSAVYSEDIQAVIPALQERSDVGRRTRMTQEKDTLWSIAKDSRESRAVTVQQQMLAIVRLNPDAFIAENVNGLKKDYLLRLPELFEASLLSASAALREVKRQYKSWVDEGYAGAVNAASTAGQSRRLRILDTTASRGDVRQTPLNSDMDRTVTGAPLNDQRTSAKGAQAPSPEVPVAAVGATESDASADLDRARAAMQRTPEAVAAPGTSNTARADDAQDKADAVAAGSTPRTMPLPKAASRIDSSVDEAKAAADKNSVVRDSASKEDTISPGLVAISATVLLTLALMLMAWRRRRNNAVATKLGREESAAQSDEFAVTEPTVARADADTTAASSARDNDAIADPTVSPPRKPLLAPPTDLPSMAAASSDDEDIIETRIKLAIAFIEVGDEQGARDLLHEVIEEGDEEQQMAAQLLIDDLDDKN